jgi:alpha-1,2-mannosyltransferase
VPRGWKLGLLGVAVVLAVEPIRTTLGYGQVNTLLMALVVADLLPDRPGPDGTLPRRRIPQGTLIGLAAAIKLTPMLFVVFAFVAGRRRAALTGLVSFAVFTGIGAVLLFSETVEFFTGLSGGDTRTASPLYAGNQSLLGVFFRLGDTSRTTTLIGLGIAGVVALLGTLVAAHWWRAGEKVFAVALVGLCTCLASPLSWTHHYVWILPMAVAVLAARIPRWARLLAGAWVLWVCACLPLAALPYGGGRERSFDLLQQLVANLGPVLGVLLVAGLAWQMVVENRAPRAAVTRS